MTVRSLAKQGTFSRAKQFQQRLEHIDHAEAIE